MKHHHAKPRFSTVAPVTWAAALCFNVMAAGDASTVEVVPASQRAEIGVTGYGWSTEWISGRQGLAVTTEVLVPEAFQSRGLLHVWSLRTGRVLRSVNTPSRVQVIAGDGRTPVVIVAGGAFNKNIDDVNYVWMVDLQTGKVVRELPVWPKVMQQIAPQFRSQITPQLYLPSIQQGALSRDGTQFLLKFTDACAAYDLAGSGTPRSLPGDAWEKLAVPYAARVAALPNWADEGGAQDGKLTLVSTEKRVAIWRNDTWEQMLPLGPAGTMVNCWTPSADGSVLLALRLSTQGAQGPHLIWDLRTLEVTEWSEPRLAEAHCLPALTQDGSILRFARYIDGGRMEFVSRDWRNDKERLEGNVTLAAPAAEANKLPDEATASFSDDALALAIGTPKGSTLLRWIDPGLSKPRITNAAVPVGGIAGLGGIGGVACDGSAVYYLGPIVNDNYANRPARVWDVATGQTAEVMAIKTLGHPPSFVLQSLPGVLGEAFTYRVSGASAGPYGFGLQTRLNPRSAWQRQPDDELWALAGASFVRTADGGSVLVKFFDSSISSHDARTGHKLAELKRNDLWPRRALHQRVTAPLAGRIFLGLDNGGTQLLDVQPDGTFKPVAQLWSPAPGSWLAVLPDGRYAVSPTAQPPVFFRQGGKLYPVEDFDARLNQPDAVAAALDAPAEVVAELRAQREKRIVRLGPAAVAGASGAGPGLTLSSVPPLLHDAEHLPLAGVVQAGSHAVTHLELHVNDVPVFGKQGFGFAVPSGASSSFKLDVPLSAGSNKVQLAARDANGALSDRETFIVHRSRTSCNPSRVVLAVGIADYNDTLLQDLTYAPKDAADIAGAMTRVHGRFTDSRAKILADSQAKRSDILAAKDFLKNTRPEDEVIVFVSGHGVINGNGDYLFCAADFQSGGFKNGLSFADLEGLFEGIPALNRLLLVDSCHSGELDDEQVSAVRAKYASRLAAKGVVLRQAGNHKGGVTPPSQGPAVRRAATDVFLDLRRTTGATVLSASGGLEFAMEDSEQKNGLFTHAILKTLDQTAQKPDGELTASALVQTVANSVQEMTEGQQHPEARFTNLATDFPVISIADGRPPGRPEDVVKRYAEWSAGQDWSGFPRIGSCFAPDVVAFNKRTTPAAVQAEEEAYRARFTQRTNRIQNLVAGTRAADGSVPVRYDLVFEHGTAMPAAEASRIIADVAAGKKRGWKAGHVTETAADGRAVSQWMTFSGTHQMEALVRQIGHEWKIVSLRVAGR